MLTRLLDTLLPAIVLVAMVFAMSTSFGGLGASSALRTVTLERVVIIAPRELPATVVVQASAPEAMRTVR